MKDLSVINGRLQRRNVKLIKQRDHWKEQYEKLKAVLDQFPMYQKRYEDLQRWRADIQTTRDMQQRIKEQTALINSLMASKNHDQ